MPGTAIKIFISYAHKDAPFFEVFRDGIRAHLQSSANFDFSSWTDENIPLGANWHHEIQKNLDSADVAILCVSANFLNSHYIRSDEFEALVNKYPATLILPLYFNHCNTNAWQGLAVKQFFKPGGHRYGEAEQADFAFCNLVNFRQSDGLQIPNPGIDLYLQDFVQQIEKAIIAKQSGGTIVSPNKQPDDGGTTTIKVKSKKITDRIVEVAILAAIVLSLLFIVYTLTINAADSFDAKKFNSTIGAAMFFGSSGLFVLNRKFQHT
jgi:hypothetical protein